MYWRHTGNSCGERTSTMANQEKPFPVKGNGVRDSAFLQWFTEDLCQYYWLLNFPNKGDFEKLIIADGLNKSCRMVVNYFIDIWKSTGRSFGETEVEDREKGLFRVRNWWKKQQHLVTKYENFPISLYSTQPKGILNYLNSCYLNACLQVLFVTEVVCKYVLEHIHPTKEGKLRILECTTCALKETFLLKSQTPNQKHFRPDILCKFLRDRMPHFSPFFQNDAVYLFGMLLMEVEEEHRTLFCNIKDRPKSLPGDTPFLGGVLQSEVKCTKCLNKSTRNEIFLELCIPVCSSVKNGIQDFFNCEDLLAGNAAYYCERCKCLTDGVRRFSIVMLPQFLAVTMKRFDIGGNRIDSTEISNSKTIDLKRFLINDAGDAEDLKNSKYELVGEITHQGGSISSGHYTATVKTPDGNVFFCNDTEVNKIAKDGLSGSKGSVLLLYSRMVTDAQVANATGKSQAYQDDCSSTSDITKTNGTKMKSKPTCTMKALSSDSEDETSASSSPDEWKVVKRRGKKYNENTSTDLSSSGSSEEKIRRQQKHSLQNIQPLSDGRMKSTSSSNSDEKSKSSHDKKPMNRKTVSGNVRNSVIEPVKINIMQTPDGNKNITCSSTKSDSSDSDGDQSRNGSGKQNIGRKKGLPSHNCRSSCNKTKHRTDSLSSEEDSFSTSTDSSNIGSSGKKIRCQEKKDIKNVCKKRRNKARKNKDPSNLGEVSASTSTGTDSFSDTTSNEILKQTNAFHLGNNGAAHGDKLQQTRRRNNSKAKSEPLKELKNIKIPSKIKKSDHEAIRKSSLTNTDVPEDHEDHNDQEQCCTVYGQNLLKRGKTLRLSSKMYDKYEFSIRMEGFEWSKCVQKKEKSEATLNREEWIHLLIYYFERADRERHTLNFKYSGKFYESASRKLSLDAYAHCRSGECKHFRFVVEISSLDIPPQIDVFSRGHTNHPANVQVTRQLRGKQRKLVKEKLKKISVSKYQDENVSDLSDEAFMEGNLQNVKSDDVLRKARSEALSEGDRHIDDIIDVLLMRREEVACKDVFIQHVGEPFNVHLFCEEQVKCAFEFFKGWKNITVHFDATGSLVRKPAFVNGRIYVYAGVVNCEGTVMPLFEMVSVRHDQGAIGNLLLNFRSFCIKVLKKTWPCIGRVIMDCSYAMIHSAVAQWNNMSLDTYLRLCFKYCMHEYTDNDFGRIVIIQLCRNHFLKMISTNLKNHSVGKKKRYIIMECTASLMETTSWEEFEKVFRAFCIILISKVKTRLTKKAAKTLILGQRSVSYRKLSSITDEEIEEESFVSKSTLASSPFFSACFDIVSQEREKIRKVMDSMTEEEIECSETNTSYCSRFLRDIFMPRCAPIVPLWTQLISDAHGKNKYPPPSNANAEDYFNIMKNSTHENLHNKLGRFIKIEKTFIYKKIKRIRLGIITNSAIYKKREKKLIKTNKTNKTEKPSSITERTKNRESIASEPEVDESRGDLKQGEKQEEQWKIHKFRKNKHSYFQKEKLNKTFSNDVDASFSEDEALSGPKDRSFQLLGTEELEETWSSAPLSKKKQIRKADSVRQQIVGKRSTRKVLKDLFDESPIHSASMENASSMDTSQDKLKSSENEHNIFIQRKNTATSSSSSDCVIKSSTNNEEGAVTSLNQEMQNTHYWEYRLKLPSETIVNELDCIEVLRESSVNFIKDRVRPGSCEDVLYLSDDDVPIYLRDFLRLVKGENLSPTMMDACIRAVIHSRKSGPPNITCWNTTSSRLIFQLDTDMSAINEILSTLKLFGKTSVHLFPVVHSEYWILIKIEVEKRMITILDPNGENRNVKDYKAKLLNALKAYLQLGFSPKIPEKRWRSICLKVREQSDSKHFGVHVLGYVIDILDEHKTFSFPNQSNLRIQLAELCVDHGQDIEANHDWTCANSNKFPNGLIRNVYYYYVQEPFPFLVAKLGMGFLDIDLAEFQILFNDNYLSGRIVDAAIHSILNASTRTTFLNIRYEHVSFMMKDDHVLGASSPLLRIDIFKYVLIMPFCTDNHWVLILVDCSKKLYACFDPFKGFGTLTYINKFHQFLQQWQKRNNTSIDMDGWNILDVKRTLPIQTDAANCGTFIILYTLLITQSKSTAEVYTRNVRLYIAHVILKCSSQMWSICSLCGYDDYRPEDQCKLLTDMVYCTKCGRWYHKSCDSTLNSLASSEINSTAFEFMCRLCLINDFSALEEYEASRLLTLEDIPDSSSVFDDEVMNVLRNITQEMLVFVKISECKKRLKSIHCGMTSSTRHGLFPHQISKLWEAAAGGPLIWFKDLREKFFEEVFQFYHETLNVVGPYVHLVGLPEAVIFTLKKVCNVQYDEAETLAFQLQDKDCVAEVAHSLRKKRVI